MKNFLKCFWQSGLWVLLLMVILVVLVAATSGCASSKARSIEAKGLYGSDSGQVAIGRVQVDAIPEGVDSAVIHYTEDTAWLSPSTKIHKIARLSTFAGGEKFLWRKPRF